MVRFEVWRRPEGLKVLEVMIGESLAEAICSSEYHGCIKTVNEQHFLSDSFLSFS